MKCTLFFLIALCTLFPLFGDAPPDSRDIWISLGFEWENSLAWERDGQTGKTTESTMTSRGTNLSAYFFWDQGDLGLHASNSLLLPYKANYTLDGVSTDIDISDYQGFFRTGFVIGPAYRRSLSPRLTLRTALGPSLFLTSGWMSNYSFLSLNLGIGLDGGIKINLLDGFFLDTGVKGGMDFYNWSALRSSLGNSTGPGEDYFMLRIQPYLCLGKEF